MKKLLIVLLMAAGFANAQTITNQRQGSERQRWQILGGIKVDSSFQLPWRDSARYGSSQYFSDLYISKADSILKLRDPLTGNEIPLNQSGVISLDRFGAKGDSVTDDGAAIQRAIDFAEKNKGGYILGNSKKNYYWRTVPKLPKSLSGLLIIDLQGATVHLTSTGPRAFDFNRTADYDTFQNIILQNMNIDGGMIGGKMHIIVGSLVNDFANTAQRLMNFNNITIRNIYSYNNITDNSLSYTNHRLGIVLQTYHPTSEGIQTRVENILIDNVRIEGGNAGFLVNAGGISTTGTNAFMKRIRISNCYHRCNTLPVSFFASSNYQVGQNSTGEDLQIYNCYGENAGDNGIEVNGFQTSVISDVIIKNAYNLSFYTRNYRALSTYKSQTITYQNCTGIIDNIPGRFFSTSGANPVGNIIMKNSNIIKTGSFQTGSYVAVNFQPVNGVSRLFESFTVQGMNVNWAVSGTQTGSAFPSLMWFSTSDTTTKRKIILNDVQLNIAGSWSNAGAFTFSPRFIMIDGAFDFFSQNLQMKWAVSSAESITLYPIRIGMDYTDTFSINGNFENLSIYSNATITRSVTFKGDSQVKLSPSNWMKFSNSLFTPADQPTSPVNFFYSTTSDIIKKYTTVDGVNQEGGGGSPALIGGQDYGAGQTLSVGNTNATGITSILSNTNNARLTAAGLWQVSTNFISNYTSSNNSLLVLNTTGAQIVRNIAGTGIGLRVTQQNASATDPALSVDVPAGNGLFQVDINANAKFRTVTSTIDFGSVSANAELAAPSTISVTGAAVGDIVLIGAPNTAGIRYKGSVTSSGTVTLWACNFTTSPVDPASGSFKITIIK